MLKRRNSFEVSFCRRALPFVVVVVVAVAVVVGFGQILSKHAESTITWLFIVCCCAQKQSWS